jgi:peptidoglycan/LPS O-acetylase OafA/YrhL
MSIAEERRPFSNHFVALDGLRGVAALSVVLLHTNMWTGQSLLPRAGIAVDFFFLLSGFVVALAYERRLVSTMRFGAFVRLRMIRLFPLIILGALIGLVANFAGARPDHPSLQGVEAIWGALSAALCIPFPIGASTEPFPLNGPEWSLFFEFMASFCYGAVLYRFSDRAIYILVGLLCLPWVWFARSHGMNVGWAWSAFGFGFLRVAWPSIAGVALWRLLQSGSLPPVNLPVLALAFVLIGCFSMPMLPRLIVVLPPSGAAAFALGSVALISLIADRWYDRPIRAWLQPRLAASVRVREVEQPAAG